MKLKQFEKDYLLLKKEKYFAKEIDITDYGDFIDIQFYGIETDDSQIFPKDWFAELERDKVYEIDDLLGIKNLSEEELTFLKMIDEKYKAIERWTTSDSDAVIILSNTENTEHVRGLKPDYFKQFDKYKTYNIKDLIDKGYVDRSED